MDRVEDHNEERNKEDFPSYTVAAPNAMPDMNRDLNEEMAAEFTAKAPVSYVPREERTEAIREDEAGGTALGWVALIFAAASWFLWPVLLGATSAVIGFIAYRQGARALGGWAMAVGLIAVLLSLVIVPFYYAVT